MSYQFEQHFDDESLELYSFGTLAEARAEILEEHLLICQECRTRLDTTEQYLGAMARGSLRLRQESAVPSLLDRTRDWLGSLSSFRMPATAWAAAAIALCAVLFLSTANLRRGETILPTFTASLIANRSVASTVPAHHPLLIHLDTRGLDLGSTVNMVLVDSIGRKIDEKTSAPGAFVDFQTSHTLQPGAYYMRILKPASSEAAREFALDVR